MKKDTTEPTGLQQAMASVDAGESPFPVEPFTDFVEAAPFPLESRIKSVAPLDEPIEPSVRPSLFGGMSNQPGQRNIGAAPELAMPYKQTDLYAEAATQLVNDRAKTHGNYADTARISQAFKKLVLLELDAREYRGQPALTDAQHESVDMICLKLARIISGNSGSDEHWSDVAGYARIALDQ